MHEDNGEDSGEYVAKVAVGRLCAREEKCIYAYSTSNEVKNVTQIRL